jgi:hypothetical protein
MPHPKISRASEHVLEEANLLSKYVYVFFQPGHFVSERVGMRLDGDAYLSKEGVKLLMLTTPIRLDRKNFAIKESLN